MLFLSLLFGMTMVVHAQKTVKKKFTQGLCLTILWKQGNQMPSPDTKPSKGKLVDREVFIYQLTNRSQVTLTEEGFYQNIKALLVKKIRSGKDGKVCVTLPAGTYSIFTKEEKGLYANIFDGENNICPITVQKNKITQTTFEITHQAVF